MKSIQLKIGLLKNNPIYLYNRIILPWVLFILVGGIYLIVRLIGLEQFPIYFFTDEAIQTVSAEELIQNNFYDSNHEFLPTYFKNGTFYNLCVSVYAQVIPTLLFGKSIFNTRLVSVLISLLGALSLGLILKFIFKVKYWWAVVLILSSFPAWFLHSRTAFETVIFSSLYGIFLFCYFLYRKVAPGYIFLVVLYAALSFYTYSPGQVIIVFSCLLFFISDISYHWKQIKWLLASIFEIVVFSVPYLRFITQQENAPLQHLRDLDSYLLQPIPIIEKIFRYFHEYIFGLNPAYWFFPNKHDLPRHLFDGYAHISLIFLPFFLIGFLLVIRKIRKTEYRTLLLSLLATPVGSSLVGIGITRMLVFAIPAALIVMIGIDKFCYWVELFLKQKINRWKASLSKEFQIVSSILSPAALFLLLSFWNLWLLMNALVRGPTWFDDYGLYGMQYGAKQLFEYLIPQYLDENKNTQIFVSSIWANGADVFPRFFLSKDEQRRVQMGSIDTYLSNQLNPEQLRIFIITQEEFDQIITSKKMRIDKVEKILPFPNGKAGFYAVRLSYLPGIEKLFKLEKEERRKPRLEQINLYNQVVWVSYSQIDAGQLKDIFDGDRYTLIRGIEANPFVIEIEFSKNINMTGLSADFGSMDFDLSMWIYQEGNDKPDFYVQKYRNLPPDPHIEFNFERTIFNVKRIRLEILNINQSLDEKIHIREVKLLY